MSGRVRAAEALIRWHRPGHGLVLPAEFIPFAQESWLIVEIDRVVLDKAGRVLAEWVKEGQELSIAVNIAGRHVVEADLVGDVRDAPARHHAPPRLLTLEITEDDLLTDVERAAAVLGELRSLGVRIALDDFGTGYSSVNYLRRLPIDIIKIDRTYVSELSSSGSEREIVAGVVQLAAGLHLDVVAEGVETAFQADHLRSIGCPQLQGFLIARPMPQADFAPRDWSTPLSADPPARA